MASRNSCTLVVYLKRSKSKYSQKILYLSVFFPFQIIKVFFVDIYTYRGKIIRFLTEEQMQAEVQKYGTVDSQDKIPQDIVDFCLKNPSKI